MLSFRKARQDDSTDLTLCMDAAARGLSAWGWSNFSNKGQSAFEFGRERIRTDESSKLYFKNWVVCELNNSLLGAFLGFRVDDPYPEINFDNSPKYFYPIIELERCASGSWLLQAISILPEFRGKGYAIHILREVEADAKQSGVKQIALQVESENEVAFGFYQRNGYREIESSCLLYTSPSPRD